MGDFAWKGGHLAETQREKSDVSAGPFLLLGEAWREERKGPLPDPRGPALA